jgi:P27 family predicted phage terminase small subunit
MAKAGRRPKPTAIRILEGTANRKPPSREPSAPKGIPPLPERLNADAVALAKWHELSAILTGMGVLTTGDGEALATLCEVHAAEQSCLLQLRAGGAVMHTDLGGVKPNPAGPMYRSLVAMKASLLSEFGLTPSSRTKLATTIQAPQDDLEAFFTRHG